jgi:hypothetical protein
LNLTHERLTLSRGHDIVPRRRASDVSLRMPMVAIVLALAGCKNSCQELCEVMADFAADECGLVVTPQEIDACIESQAGKDNKEDRATCREFGSAEKIREEWGCEELEDYFDAQSS